MDLNSVLKCIGLEPKKFQEQKEREIQSSCTKHIHTILSMGQLKIIAN